MALNENKVKPEKTEAPSSDHPSSSNLRNFIAANTTTVVFSAITIVLVLVFGGLLYKHYHSASTTSPTAPPNVNLLTQGSPKRTNKDTQSANSTVVSVPKGVSSSTYKTIIANITSRNITGLKESFAASVKIVDLFNGSNQTYSGSNANDELAILLNGASAPWIWGVPISELNILENGTYSQYFNNNDIIGTSTNGYTISVQLDSNGDITQVFIAPTSTVDGSTNSSDTGAYHPAPSDTGNGGD